MNLHGSADCGLAGSGPARCRAAGLVKAVGVRRGEARRGEVQLRVAGSGKAVAVSQRTFRFGGASRGKAVQAGPRPAWSARGLAPYVTAGSRVVASQGLARFGMVRQPGQSRHGSAAFVSSAHRRVRSGTSGQSSPGAASRGRPVPAVHRSAVSARRRIARRVSRSSRFGGRVGVGLSIASSGLARLVTARQSFANTPVTTSPSFEAGLMATDQRNSNAH